jgi:hypothetical protein
MLHLQWTRDHQHSATDQEHSQGQFFTLTVNVQNFFFSNPSYGKELVAGVGTGISSSTNQ